MDFGRLFINPLFHHRDTETQRKSNPSFSVTLCLCGKCIESSVANWTYARLTLGDFELSVFSDGTYPLDGGAFFGVVPKVMWSRKVRVG